MATKKKPTKESPKIPRPAEIAEGPIPYQYSDTIEPAVVIEDRTTAPAETETIVQEVVEPKQPAAVQTPAAAPAAVPAAKPEAAPVIKQTPVAAPQAATPAAVEADPARSTISKAYSQQNKAFVDYLQDMKDEYERAKKEGEQEIANSKKAARWAGATELASSIANLIGVGAGNAVSQQYKSATQDWMRKADQDMREHRSRLENLRQRQRETQMKIAQLRSQGDIALAEYDVKRAQQKVENDLNRQKAYLDAQYKSGQLSLQQYEAETKRLEAASKEAYNMGSLANDTIVAKSTAAKNYASAKASQAQAERYKRLGSDAIEIPLAPVGDAPSQTILVDPASLVNTIQSNISVIEMTPDQRSRVENILNNEELNPTQMGEALKFLAAENPGIRKMLIDNFGVNADEDEDGGGDAVMSVKEELRK